MIKLSGSRFTDILPANLASQVETKAFAYAVGRQIEKLCAYSDAARTYAAIATMPEWLLDYMAVELRTPSYDENYSIKTKRALIEGSLLFYTQMGTPAAVNRIIETIFETGYIEEWYEYDGDPHHFRAYVGDGELPHAGGPSSGRHLRHHHTDRHTGGGVRGGNHVLRICNHRSRQ